MPHFTPLISTIVAGLVLAFILAAIAQRLRASPLVGYLLAGVLLGPAIPSFYTADQALANELAEIGVILLMFGVGLHFSLKDQAKAINADLPIIARADSEAEIEHLMKHGASAVVMGEHEIAKAMLGFIPGAEAGPRQRSRCKKLIAN